MERILFLGLGYIGLPTAALAASRGLEVVGVDVDPAIVGKVNRGEIHIVEPGLAEAVRDGCAARARPARDRGASSRKNALKKEHVSGKQT